MPPPKCPGTSATLCRKMPPKNQVNDLVVLFFPGESITPVSLNSPNHRIQNICLQIFPIRTNHPASQVFRRSEIIKSEDDVYNIEILKDYPTRNGLLCEGLFSQKVRDKIPFWYRESNMMDRQLNKGSSKIAYAVRAGARSRLQEKRLCFAIPGATDCKHQTCAVDCIHSIRHTVPIQGNHPAKVEGGRAC
jgi:hypothetical protein